MYRLIESFDKTLLDIFNKDLKHPVFDFLFPLITRLGEVVVFIPLCLGLFFLKKKRGRRAAALLIITYIVSHIVFLGLKRLAHRPRPFLVYPDLNVIGTVPPFSSFPSGHVAMTTALAVVLGSKYEDLQWLMWIIVALVAVSRMYMGLHYPIDVVGGAAVGLGVGYLVLYGERKFSKKSR
ncbi:MAG: phosphatase PAP2 family protein [Candidatus Omnitrophota bacterium]